MIYVYSKGNDLIESLHMTATGEFFKTLSSTIIKNTSDYIESKWLIRKGFSNIYKETDEFLKSVSNLLSQIQQRGLFFDQKKLSELLNMISFLFDKTNKIYTQRVIKILNKTDFGQKIAARLNDDLNKTDKYIQPFTGTVLVGKSGTGKTTMLQIIALMSFFLKSYSDNKQVIYKLSGSTFDVENPVKFVRSFTNEITKQLNKGKSIVILIDEGERLFSKRQMKDSVSRAWLEFMSIGKSTVENNTNKKGKLMIVLATNHLENMDKSAIRRFSSFLDFNIDSIFNTMNHFYIKLNNILPKKFNEEIINDECFDDILSLIINHVPTDNHTISPAEIENIIYDTLTKINTLKIPSMLAFILSCYDFIHKQLKLDQNKSNTAVKQHFFELAIKLQDLLNEYKYHTCNLKLIINAFYFNENTIEFKITSEKDLSQFMNNNFAKEKELDFIES